MSDRADGRMRLTVLGGYLGSGKTTWLRHQLHDGSLSDAFVVVNEAAETPVDDVLLARSSRIAVLAGGCACCTARADLLMLLKGICDERSRTASADTRLQRIVLETSGLAVPGPILRALGELGPLGMRTGWHALKPNGKVRTTSLAQRLR